MRSIITKCFLQIQFTVGKDISSPHIGKQLFDLNSTTFMKKYVDYKTSRTHPTLYLDIYFVQYIEHRSQALCSVFPVSIWLFFLQFILFHFYTIHINLKHIHIWRMTIFNDIFKLPANFSCPLKL